VKNAGYEFHHYATKRIFKYSLDEGRNTFWNLLLGRVNHILIS